MSRRSTRRRPAAAPGAARAAQQRFEQAVTLHLAGEHGQAVAEYRHALELNPALAEAHNNLGVLLREPEPDTALAAFQRAVALRPAYPEALNNLGLMLQRHGDLRGAADAFRRAVRADPHHPDAQNNLGLVLRELGESEAAVEHLRAAVRLRPLEPAFHNNLGNALLGLGLVAEARQSYQHALELRPDYPEAVNNLGATLRAERRFSEAIPLLLRALELRPGYLDALHNLALAIPPDEALTAHVLEVLRAAVAARPTCAATRAVLAVGLQENGRFVEAGQVARETLALDERNAGAWNVVGICAGERLDHVEAIHAFEHALALEPENVTARWNRALSFLMLGDYARGWREYEWRWRLVHFVPFRRRFAQPAWDGAPLGGRTVLLYAEQGLGDAIQFARYARCVQDRGGRVLVECDRSLTGLLESCDGVDAVVARGEPLPHFDVQAPLLSVPLLIGDTLATLPREPYLRATPRPVRRRVRQAGEGALRVGIVWGGRQPNPTLARRSAGLPRFEPLAAIPGVQLYSLQVGEEATRQLAESPLRDTLVDLAPELRDFRDTAAAIAELDLVLTIDTSVAHLAGALGMPVWVLLMHAADWRWLLDRADSPWYPSARLYRQPAPGEWGPVFEQVRRDLAALAREEAAPRSAAVPAREPADPTAAALPSAQRGPDGAPRFTLQVPFSRLADEAGFALFQQELVGGGVAAEVRCFLDDALRDGDIFVDVDAGWGLASLGAATHPTHAPTTVAVFADAEDARLFRANLAAIVASGVVEVVMVPEFGAMRLDAVAGERGRVFVRVADAAVLPHVLASAPTLLEDGRLAALLWTPRVAGGGLHPQDEIMLGGLAALGFDSFRLVEDDTGPVLVPFRPEDGPGAALSLSAACLAAQTDVNAEPPALAAVPAAPAVVTAEPAAAFLGLDWQIGTTSGWGVYGLNLVRRCLRRGDHHPVLFGAPALAGLHAEELAALQPVFTRQRELEAALAADPLAHASAEFPVLYALGNGLRGGALRQRVSARRSVGVVFFEDTHLDAGALARGQHFDRIVAGSTWNAELLRAHGFANVAVCLQGIDPAVFRPGPRTGRFGDRFVVFSGGKLEYRKGQDLVIAAFREFQRRHPEALLVSAWHNHWPQTMREITTAGHVRGVPEVRADGGIDFAGWLERNGVPRGAALDVGLVPNAAMGELVREAHVALFPNRGEGGTNLVAMECMASGVPTILSANTGHLDLVGDDVCFVLREQRPARPTEQFAGTEGWGDSSVEEILAVLEAVHADQAEAERRGRAAAGLLAGMAWEHQIDHLLVTLSDLY